MATQQPGVPGLKSGGLCCLGSSAAESVSHSNFQPGRSRGQSAHLLGESWPTDHQQVQWSVAWQTEGSSSSEWWTHSTRSKIKVTGSQNAKHIKCDRMTGVSYALHLVHLYVMLCCVAWVYAFKEHACVKLLCIERYRGSVIKSKSNKLPLDISK